MTYRHHKITHRERQVALTVCMSLLTALAVLWPQLQHHCTLGGLAVNLFWLWE